MIRAGLVLLPLLTAACAPVPPTRADAVRQCRAEDGLADGVVGSIGAGVSNNGPVGDASITVTNRVLNPHSEEDFIPECIDREMEGRAPATTYGISAGRRP